MTARTFKVCPLPFSLAEIHQDGRVWTCCPFWLKPEMEIGNIKDGRSLAEIFNGEKAQYIRTRIRQGNYQAVCNEWCPKLEEFRACGFFTSAAWKPPSDELLRKVNDTGEVTGFPFECVTVASDPRCNLRCVMCRKDNIFSLPPKGINAAKTLAALLPDLDQIRELKLCGDGEPFFIPEVREFLFSFPQDKYPELGFNIQTNGLLLTRETLRRISHLNIITVVVSVDGGTKKTYERIRRNGNWDRLMENLEALSEAYRDGRIGCFVLVMTLMRENIGEMMDLYRLSKRLKCPFLTFQRMHMHFHDNIFDPPDPVALSKLKGVLELPEMKSEYVHLVGLQDVLSYVPPLVSVVIGGGASGEALGKCLDSLARLDYPKDSLEFISAAPLPADLETRLPGAKAPSGRAKGEALEALTEGLRLARGEYIAVLDEGAELPGDWLSRMLAPFLTDPSTGIAGSKILQGPAGVIRHAGGVYDGDARTLPRGEEEKDDGRFDIFCEVGWVSSSALMISRKCLAAIGLPPPRYRTPWGDAAWSAAARRAGFKVVYVPEAVASLSEPPGGAPSGHERGIRLRERYRFLIEHSGVRRWVRAFLRDVGDRAAGVRGSGPGISAAVRAFLWNAARLPRTIAHRGRPHGTP